MKLMNTKLRSLFSLVVFSFCLCAYAIPSDLAADPFSATSPKIAMDSFGNAYAVWEEQTEGINYIQYSTLPLEGNWTTPQVLSLEGFDSTSPLIAVNAAGDAVAIWLSIDSELGISCVYGAMLPAGESWTTAERVSSSGEDAQADYQLFLDNSGNVIVTWSGLVINDQQVIRAASGSILNGWNASVQVSGP